MEVLPLVPVKQLMAGCSADWAWLSANLNFAFWDQLSFHRLFEAGDKPEEAGRTSTVYWSAVSAWMVVIRPSSALNVSWTAVATGVRQLVVQQSLCVEPVYCWTRTYSVTPQGDCEGQVAGAVPRQSENIGAQLLGLAGRDVVQLIALGGPPTDSDDPVADHLCALEDAREVSARGEWHPARTRVKPGPGCCVLDPLVARQVWSSWQSAEEVFGKDGGVGSSPVAGALRDGQMEQTVNPPTSSHSEPLSPTQSSAPPSAELPTRNRLVPGSSLIRLSARGTRQPRTADSKGMPTINQLVPGSPLFLRFGLTHDAPLSSHARIFQPEGPGFESRCNGPTSSRYRHSAFQADGCGASSGTTCLFVSCRYHLFLLWNPASSGRLCLALGKCETGYIKFKFKDSESLGSFGVVVHRSVCRLGSKTGNEKHRSKRWICLSM